MGITRSNPELVSNIGLCNFDSEHTEEVCQYLQQQIGEVGIVSNQVQVSISKVSREQSLTSQFSLLDSRPLMYMCDICDKYGLKLLTYGSFVGVPLQIQPGMSLTVCSAAAFYQNNG